MLLITSLSTLLFSLILIFHTKYHSPCLKFSSKCKTVEMNQELLFWRVLLTLPLLSEALDLERAFEEGKFQAINIEGYHLNIF